jgi:stage II sporulation protein R
MRKKLVYFFILLLISSNLSNLKIVEAKQSANNIVEIPNEAIRLRILANSDSASDQTLKRKIRDNVNREITRWVAQLKDIEEAREMISSNIPEINKVIEQTMKEENNIQQYKVEFGATKFPTKLYGEMLYPAGEYEALKIVLGEGKGANWWCVLFPPLCFLDFNSGTAEKKKDAEVVETSATQVVAKEEKKEVRFFFLDLFDSIFN